MIKNSKILITGGTGSLGFELTRILSEHNKIIVYSRNEERQYEMKQQFKNVPLIFRIGDVRDTDTLEYSLRGCDYVIHAAAMKDVIMCEEQPTQTVYNNIDGSRSVITAAYKAKVKKAVAVSTDKAAAPSNVYGASKYIMEKMFAEANHFSETLFCSVRFGNMIDSRGSLVSIWKQNPNREIKITHPEISRFFFTVNDGANTVIQALEMAKGGEIFIKKMKMAKIKDVLTLITGKKEFEVMGLFPGEKVHEDLLSQNEVHHTFEQDDYYVIRPMEHNPNPPKIFSTENAVPFSPEELKELVFNAR